MSKIGNLVKQLCPNGVEWKALGEVLIHKQPSKYIVKSTKYSSDYKIPVLTAGKTFVLGYTSEEDGIYKATKDKPVIIFDDFTTSMHWVDFPFKVKSSAMKILLPLDTDNINFRYIFYAMRCIKYEPQDHARQWISAYAKFPIPIPPLPVQEEIVRILDTYTALELELEMELSKELEARKAQYSYYRNPL